MLSSLPSGFGTGPLLFYVRAAIIGTSKSPSPAFLMDLKATFALQSALHLTDPLFGGLQGCGAGMHRVGAEHKIVWMRQR